MSDLARTVLKGAANLLADKNQASSSSHARPGNSGSYNIRGHFNNVPVDLRVQNVSHGSARAGSSGSGEQKFVQYNKLARSVSVSQNYNQKPNTGNVEVKIKRVETSFAKMKLSSNPTNQNVNKQIQQGGKQPNSSQTKASAGSGNTQKCQTSGSGRSMAASGKGSVAQNRASTVSRRK